MNVERAESANLITATTGASVNLVTKGSRHAAVVSQLSSESIGDLMMENLDPVRHARVVAGAAVLAGLAVSIASCSGNRFERAVDHATADDDNHDNAVPDPGAPPSAPTEKSINPTGGNLFTPTVHAPPAPTAIPGNRENTG